MVTYENGFKLEVTVSDGMPHVRVSCEDGTVVVNTKAVSVTGLENLSGVFERAALIAFREYESFVRRNVRLSGPDSLSSR
jgi:hypothetical protein